MKGNLKRILYLSIMLTVALASFRIEAQGSTGAIEVHTGQFYTPAGLGYAESRGLLLADSGGNNIRLITKNGSEVFAGKAGQTAGYVDGIARDAMFNSPLSLAVAKDGTVYVCDTDSFLIRRIRGGYVDTVAGSGRAGYSEGTGIAASFDKPQGIAVSDEGIIYIADTLNHCIRKMDKAGNVSLFAGTPKNHGNADGSALTASFYEPSGIAVGSDGAVYVADTANHTIRKIQNGAVSTVSGKRGVLNSDTGYYSGGFKNGDDPLFNFPKGVAVADDGFIYVADTYNHSVRKVSPDGSATTVIGNGEPGKLYGSYKNAKLSRPYGIAVNGQTLYVSDSLNDAVLEIPLDNEALTALPTRNELIAEAGINQYVPELSVCLNNQILNLNAKPVKTHDSFTLPLSEFFDALGARHDYDEAAKTITVEKNRFKTVLISGEHFVIEDGIEMLDVNALINLFPYVVEWYPEYNVLVVKE